MKNPNRHILISLLGRTPQLLTESLYALKIQKQIPISEIWVLTTPEGKQAVYEKLLSQGKGQFYKFCHDWDIDQESIQFDSNNFLIAPARESLSADQEGCEPLVDKMMELVRKLTSESDTILYCSLAGGRKTMSVYLAYTLQLYGRTQDKLFHVLTSPEVFEDQKNFYYPPPKKKKIKLSDGKKIYTDLADVLMVDVPYVHLRQLLPFPIDEMDFTFDELVHWTQQMLELPQLVIDLHGKCIFIGNKKVDLTPIEFATYQYYAERSRDRSEKIQVTDYVQYFEKFDGYFLSDEGLARLLEIYTQLVSAGTVDRFKYNALKKGRLPYERACEHFSRIKGKIKKALNENALLDYYIISGVGRYGKCYGIKLDKSRIVFK